MDAYIWTLLLSGFSNTALALEARPAPAATPPVESTHIEQLIDAHRGVAAQLRLVPVAAPAPASPRADCPQTND